MQVDRKIDLHSQGTPGESNRQQIIIKYFQSREMSSFLYTKSFVNNEKTNRQNYEVMLKSFCSTASTFVLLLIQCVAKYRDNPLKQLKIRRSFSHRSSEIQSLLSSRPEVLRRGRANSLPRPNATLAGKLARAASL